MPKISIVIPCYNQAKYISECLQSVVDQSYTDWECIVVDDGSGDNIAEVMRPWLEEESRISFYSKSNGGVASTRNFGIEKATGEWILPLDGDDKIGVDYLRLAAEQMKNQVELIYCSARFFGAKEGLWSLRDYSYPLLLVRNVVFCTAFYRRSSWKAIGGYDTDMVYGYEDWEFWIRLLNANRERVVKLDYIGFYYRKLTDSRSIELNAHDYKMKYTLDYILAKHRTIYEELYPYNIPLLRSAQENEENLSQIKNQLGKNFITRLLYAIIRRL